MVETQEDWLSAQIGQTYDFALEVKYDGYSLHESGRHTFNVTIVDECQGLTIAQTIGLDGET